MLCREHLDLLLEKKHQKSPKALLYLEDDSADSKSEAEDAKDIAPYRFHSRPTSRPTSALNSGSTSRPLSALNNEREVIDFSQVNFQSILQGTAPPDLANFQPSALKLRMQSSDPKKIGNSQSLRRQSSDLREIGSTQIPPTLNTDSRVFYGQPRSATKPIVAISAVQYSDRRATPYVQPQVTPYVQLQATPYVQPQPTPFVQPQPTSYVQSQPTSYVQPQSTPYVQKQPTPYVQPQPQSAKSGNVSKINTVGSVSSWDWLMNKVRVIKGAAMEIDNMPDSLKSTLHLN